MATNKIGTGDMLGLAVVGLIAFKLFSKGSKSKVVEALPYKGYVVKIWKTDGGYYYTITGRGLNVKSDFFDLKISAAQAAAFYVDRISA